MSVEGIIGRKVGMTQVYAADGRAIPVTVIQAGPCVVVQRKSKEKDGYSAVQLGFVENRTIKRVTKPMTGHFKKASLPPCRVLREFRVEDVRLKVGDKVRSPCSPPATTERVGTEGEGFPGRHHRHHSRRCRDPGSFTPAECSNGSSAFPSRVLRACDRPGTWAPIAHSSHPDVVSGAESNLRSPVSVPGAGGGT